MIAIPDTRLIDRLRRAQRLVVFTGAGMSAESGIPTFRDRLTGLWAHTDPTEVATPQAFRSNPQPTALTSQVTALGGTAAQILPELFSTVWG